MNKVYPELYDRLARAKQEGESYESIG
jgi:hypothetical protein